MSNITSVETQEVAGPVETDVESVETQEVAEPVSDNKDVTTTEESRQTDERDSAFADMRRRLEQAERENQQMIEALSLYFDGDNGEDLSIQAQAYAQQRSPEEIREELEAMNEYDALVAENEYLKQTALNAEIEKAVDESLRLLNSIDPNIKTYEDIENLGDDFLSLISAGVDTETAFYATQAKKYKNTPNAPNPIGKINNNQVERDYYTSEELDNLSKAEIRANWDKVERSMKRL